MANFITDEFDDGDIPTSQDWQAWQQKDMDELERELMEILDRVASGMSTLEDAKILQRELGLSRNEIR